MENNEKQKAVIATRNALSVLKIARKQLNGVYGVSTLLEGSLPITKKGNIHDVYLLVKRAKEDLDEFNLELSFHTNVSYLMELLEKLICADFTDIRINNDIVEMNDNLDIAIERVEYFMNRLR